MLSEEPTTRPPRIPPPANQTVLNLAPMVVSWPAVTMAVPRACAASTQVRNDGWRWYLSVPTLAGRLEKPGCLWDQSMNRPKNLKSQPVVPSLELIRDGQVVRVFEITGTDLHIGRTRGSEIQLDDYEGLTEPRPG